MSIEPMTMVTISGPVNMIDTAIQNLLVNRQFHPENAIMELSEIRQLLPFESVNPYTEHLSRARSLTEKMQLKLSYHDFDENEFNVEGAGAYIENLERQVEDNRRERGAKTTIIQNNTALIGQLENFANIDVKLINLFQMRYVKFHFGRIPKEVYDGFSYKINARSDVYCIESGRSEHWVYVLTFVLLSDYTRVDALFFSAGFERIRIHLEEFDDVDSTANELIERLRLEIREAGARAEELDALYKEMLFMERDKLLKAYSWLRFNSESFDLHTYAGHRHGKFYILGWVPKSISEEYAKECESYDGFACALNDPRDKKGIFPPVKLKKSFISSIYEPFVEMYGLPSYGEIDPRLFMALTYTLIFGIMFGDVGQGLCLLLVGVLIWKLKGAWLGRILALCGLSSAAMGFVYGSVFGSEKIIEGFHVLQDGNAMTVLLVSVGIGVFVLLLCMILNIITGIRQRDIKKILFEPNGIAGVALYGGVAYGAIQLLVNDVNVFTLPYILSLVVLPLAMMFSAAPLSKLLKGDENWKPKSVGMFFVEGFFEMFEILLSYASNTISFLRIGAYAISHSGMMMVVYLLSSGADGGQSITGLIFGNVLITGFEVALVSIQIIRLEYYEIFGRFYSGRGRKFTPVEINYSLAG